MGMAPPPMEEVFLSPFNNKFDTSSQSDCNLGLFKNTLTSIDPKNSNYKDPRFKYINPVAFFKPGVKPHWGITGDKISHEQQSHISSGTPSNIVNGSNEIIATENQSLTSHAHRDTTSNTVTSTTTGVQGSGTQSPKVHQSFLGPQTREMPESILKVTSKRSLKQATQQ